MHLRNEIKRRVVDILTRRLPNGEYCTAVEDRVYRNRFQPLSDDPDEPAHLPAIRVFVVDESVTKPGEVDVTQSRRTDKLMIEVIASGESADDDLDTITNQVEDRMQRDDNLEGLVAWVYLTGTKIGYDDSSDSTIQSAVMAYDVEYFTSNASTLPLDDFDELDVTQKWPSGATITTFGMEMP